MRSPFKHPNVFDKPAPRQAYTKGKRITVRCPHCKEKREITESTWVASGRRPFNAWVCGSCRRQIAKTPFLTTKSIIPGHNGCFPVRHKEMGIFRVNCRGSRVALDREGEHDCPSYESCMYYAACLDWRGGFTSNGIDFRTGKRIYPKGSHGKLIMDVSPGLEIYSEEDPDDFIARGFGANDRRSCGRITCRTMAAWDVL